MEKPKWLERIKKIKHIEWILLAVGAAVMLLIYFSPVQKESTNGKTNTSISLNSSVNQEQALLEETLSSILGAGKVRVMISYATGTVLEPAKDVESSVNTQKQKGETSESEVTTQNESSKTVTVYQNGQNTPLILVERKPEIRGVIVIAEGAGDVRVKLDLINAVRTVLNISADKVDVFIME